MHSHNIRAKYSGRRKTRRQALSGPCLRQPPRHWSVQSRCGQVAQPCPSWSSMPCHEYNYNISEYALSTLDKIAVSFGSAQSLGLKDDMLAALVVRSMGLIKSKAAEVRVHYSELRGGWLQGISSDNEVLSYFHNLDPTCLKCLSPGKINVFN